MESGLSSNGMLAHLARGCLADSDAVTCSITQCMAAVKCHIVEKAHGSTSIVREPKEQKILRKNLARVQNVVRIKSRLDPAHDLDLRLTQGQWQVTAAGGADPVFAGDRAPQ